MTKKEHLEYSGNKMTKINRRIKTCACGCGQSVNIYKRFISGHYAKTKEGGEKLSKAHLGKPPWNKGLTKETDGRIARQSLKQTGRSLSKEHIESIIKAQNRPEVKKAKSDFHSGKILSGDTIKVISEKCSKASFELWQDLEYREKQTLAKKGEKCHLWQGGITNSLYSEEWNNYLKEQIRQRDGYVCQVCFIPQELLGAKLHVHHIDYNKKNCKEENLISLCNSCHGKTSQDRIAWQSIFASQ